MLATEAKTGLSPVWNGLVLLAALASLFLLLTNAVPLIEWGWLEAFSKKSHYVRPVRIGIAVLGGLLAWLWWRDKAVFENLSLVRLLRGSGCLPFGTVLFVLFAAYVGILSMVGWMRHAALETRAFDLGIFAQAVWNTLQGDFLYSSIKGGICYLGDHVSPILALLAPVYGLWPDPRLLLFLQASASATCIVLIAYLAREKIGSNGIALVFALLYAFHFPTRSVLHDDFHPEVLAEPFMILAFIFLERKIIVPCLLSLLVMLSAKENMAGIAFMLGFYALAWKRMRVFGPVLMAGSVVLFFVSVQVVVPHFSGEAYLYRGNYDGLLASPLMGLWTRLTDPDRLEYLLKVFLPFLFLPVFHLSTLVLTFPILFQNLISENEVMRSFGYHYTVGLTPFLFISSIYAFQALSERFPKFAEKRVLAVCVLLAVALMRSGPSEYYYHWQSRKNVTPHIKMVREKLRQVPDGAKVLTHNNFIPQLANRKFVYQFDYTPAVSKAEMAQRYQADYVIMDRAFWEGGSLPLEASLMQLQEAGYRIAFEKNGFFILKLTGKI